MNAGCYGGETWRHVARVEVAARAKDASSCAVAADYDDRLSQRAARRMAAAAGTDGIFTAAWFRFPVGDRPRRARGSRVAGAAHRHAAVVAAQCRQRVPQSARRPRGAADRGVRLEGSRDRRRARVGEARELHRQSRGQGEGGRHRGADRSCANVLANRCGARAEVRIVGRERRRAVRRRERPLGAARGDSRKLGGHIRVRQSRRADGRPVGGARSVAHVRQWRAGRAARKGRGRASVRSGRARPVGAEARRLRPRVHRAARPLRRGRHGPGRARNAEDPVHRQRRDGVGAGDGQMAHQARLAGERDSDAEVSRGRRATPTGCASWPSSACR